MKVVNIENPTSTTMLVTINLKEESECHYIEVVGLPASHKNEARRVLMDLDSGLARFMIGHATIVFVLSTLLKHIPYETIRVWSDTSSPSDWPKSPSGSVRW